MKYDIATTARFEKDLKTAKKRGLDLDELDGVVTKLANGDNLPPKNHDHPLAGEYKGTRECHIKPDWLLVYEKTDRLKLITLLRTGSHSDIFG